MADMTPDGISFSIDIGGQWTERQAEAVIAALAPEADAQHVRLIAIDVTTYQDTCRRFIIEARAR